LAIDYDRKAAFERAALTRLLQQGPASARFDAEATYAAFRANPSSLSEEARHLLYDELVQRLRRQPWSLRLALDVLTLRRLDGFSMAVPTLHECGVILVAVLYLVGLLRFIRNGRRKQNQVIADFFQARRTSFRLAQDVLFGTSRRQRSRHQVPD
jgi:hypothetical protein